MLCALRLALPSSVAKLRHINAYTENGIACPTIILTGSEDGTHRNAFALKARIPNCKLKVLPGAGHACKMEQPWLFDRFMFEFLSKHGLFPAASKPGR
jgi:pimeloyl-ACP methyl ester carboxylesterase